MKKWLLLTCAVTLCACITMTETSPMTDQTFYDVDGQYASLLKSTWIRTLVLDEERTHRRE